MTENKMGTMDVPRLILNISLPMMVSMLVQALYNIVDSVFVSYYAPAGLTALSLAFPIQNLMIAVGIGTAVGVNALLSTRLGQRDQEAVDKAASNGVFLAACNFVAFFVLGLFVLRPYLTSQTDDAQVITFGMQYLNVVVLGSFGMFQVVMQDKILQGTGLTKYTMISQIAGAVANIILDPLLIFGVGPFPRMGMTGAAVATVIGQFLSMGVSLYCNVTRNHEVRFAFRSFRPEWATIRQIYAVAIPTILLNSVTSLTTYVMNLILGMFSMVAVTVYGAYFKLNSFLFMPVFGLNNGLVPIIAYNYGAGNKKRIVQTIRVGMLYGIALMVLGTAVFELFPGQLLSVFNADDQMRAIGIPALRIIASSFVGAGIAITLSSVFQAFSSAVYSMVVSFARQLVVLLPSAWLLAKTGVLDRVWLAFPIAEVASVVISLLFMLRIWRGKMARMPAER